MRRAPTRRSEDQIPHGERVQRPAQHPVKKQPKRPIATPKKSAGVLASTKAPTGRSSSSRPVSTASGIATRNPPTAQPSAGEVRQVCGCSMM